MRYRQFVNRVEKTLKKMGGLDDIINSDLLDTIVDVMFREMEKEVPNGPIHITDFGVFRISHLSECEVKIPSGETITRKRTNVLRFTPSRKLKKRINSEND